MSSLSQCPDCGATFSPGEAACPECGMELYDDPEAEAREPDEPAPRSQVDAHDRPGWDELVRESRTKSRDSLRKAKESRSMTPKPKTPTASGISRLLATAGFRRSERQIGGYGNGFAAEKVYSRDGAVRVRHRFWSMGANRDAALPHLAAYAVAIEGAGWAVEFGEWDLIVTAKTED